MKQEVVLVTGGAGFIGSHVVDLLLSQGRRVRVLDNVSTGRWENLAHQSGAISAGVLETLEADINDPEAKTFFSGVDRVIHLAALVDIVPSIERPRDYFRANVDGTFATLENARAAGVKKFVYAASSSCYGIPDEVPTSEDAEVRSQYPYAVTKNLGETLALSWGRIYGTPVVSLRFFNVYGPRSRTSGTYGAVFGVFLAQKLAAKPFTVVGDGEQSRDFTYVTDVARAVVMAAESDLADEVLNVGSGAHYSINRLVRLLDGPKVHIPKRPGEPEITFADTRRIRERLGWRPQVSFEEGVQKVLGVIDYWREARVWDPESIREATDQWFRVLGKEQHP